MEVTFNLCIYVLYINWCISFQTQNYTWNGLLILMYLYSNSEVYHSWQRVCNPPYFMKTPYIVYPSFFKFCPTPPSLSPLTSTPTALFVSLTQWLFAPHSMFILLNDIMVYTCRALFSFVPKRPCCVLYATKCQVYCVTM